MSDNRVSLPLPLQVFVVLSKNVLEGLYGVLMCVCVCEREVTRGGHGSGQHQLSECEVQPQAKAFFACGDKPDPPHPLTHTNTGPEAAPLRFYLPPSKSLH